MEPQLLPSSNYDDIAGLELYDGFDFTNAQLLCAIVSESMDSDIPSDTESMEPLEKTFICWPKHSSDTESMDKDKLSFMYLKMTNGGAAEFYNDFELKSSSFSFQTKKASSSALSREVCFESDITDEMQSWLKQFNIEINEEESKIQLTFHQDGTMGHVLYSL